MIPANELFEKLVESGIPFTLENDTEDVDIKRPFIISGVKAPGTKAYDGYRGCTSNMTSALSYLGEMASELYPDSEFAEWWRERT